MKTLFFILTFFIVFIFPVNAAASKQQYAEAVVKQEKIQEAVKAGTKQNIQQITITILEGELKNKTYSVESPLVSESKAYRAGDTVIVSYEKDNGGAVQVMIVDYVRKKALLTLFFLFLSFVFIIGRWKGFYSFLGMVFSFAIIMRFIIPNIIAGNDPILISLLGALLIIPVTFYISHGFHKETTIAICATALSLALTGLLAYVFIEFSRLTGFAAEEAFYVQTLKNGAINIKNLLLAGIIIGAMGVLDDITISQVAIVKRLFLANSKFTYRELYNHAMAVGHDHIASLVNTLILVYTGASLPLFLLFYESNAGYSQVINQEIIATEIVRTLVSSIGIIAAVPIATLISCRFARD